MTWSTVLFVAVAAAAALTGAGVLLAFRLKASSREEPVAPAPELALMLGAQEGQAALIGFFDTDSDRCVTQAPRFGEAARRLAGGAGSVAVIEVGHNSPDTLLASLGDIQTLVVQDRGQGELTEGFGVTGFPSFFMVDDRGAITARGRSVENLVN
jgi:hypothetical protein